MHSTGPGWGRPHARATESAVSPQLIVYRQFCVITRCLLLYYKSSIAAAASNHSLASISSGKDVPYSWGLQCRISMRNKSTMTIISGWARQSPPASPLCDRCKLLADLWIEEDQCQEYQGYYQQELHLYRRLETEDWSEGFGQV